MTHRLKRPFVHEDPENLLGSMMLVERVTTGRDGVVILQGRVMKADGTKGQIRTFEAHDDEIAYLLFTHHAGYPAPFARTRRKDTWEDLRDRIIQRRNEGPPR